MQNAIKQAVLCRTQHSLLLHWVSNLFTSCKKHLWRNKCNANDIFHIVWPFIASLSFMGLRKWTTSWKFDGKKWFQSHVNNHSLFLLCPQLLPIFFFSLLHHKIGLNRSYSLFMPLHIPRSKTPTHAVYIFHEAGCDAELNKAPAHHHDYQVTWKVICTKRSFKCKKVYWLTLFQNHNRIQNVQQHH